MGSKKKYSYTAVPEPGVYRYQTLEDLVRGADFSYVRAADDLQVPEFAAALLSYQLPHRWLLEHNLDGMFSAREKDGETLFDLSISELNKEKESIHRYPGVAVIQDGHIMLAPQGPLLLVSHRIITEFLSEQMTQWDSGN